MGEPVVAYSGRAARALDSVPAAVLVSQLWYLTGGGRSVTDETMEQLEHSTGLSPKQQRNARRLLVSYGWIGEERVRSSGRSRILTRVHAQAILAHIHASTAGIDAALSEPGRPPKGNAGPGSLWAPSKKEHTYEVSQDSEVLPGLEVSRKKEKPGALLAPGDREALEAIDRTRRSEYRVDAGTFEVAAVLEVISGLDGHRVDGVAFEALMFGLTALRVGNDKSPSPMPFATYNGADCAIVKRKLRTMKPSELAKAVLGATHIDQWARERGLSLAQILGRADHYVAAFDSRRVRPDRERATASFLRVYAHASSLAVPEVEEWSAVRARLSFLAVAEIEDWTRQMMERVDSLRRKRGAPPVYSERSVRDV